MGEAYLAFTRQRFSTVSKTLHKSFLACRTSGAVAFQSTAFPPKATVYAAIPASGPLDRSVVRKFRQRQRIRGRFRHRQQSHSLWG